MCDTSLSLLDRLQLGASDSAWREVVDLYTPLLDDWLARFQLQTADREDLAQESLTTVLQHVGSFQHGGQGSLLARIQPLFEPATLEAFRRVVVEGQKPRDVASALGLTVNAVLIAKSRGLRQLRRELKGLTDLIE